MQTGDTFKPMVAFYDASGAVMTGLVAGDITCTGYVDGAVQTFTVAAATYVAAVGKYALSITLPPSSPGWHDLTYTATGAAYAEPPGHEGEIENNDLDSIAYAASSPPSLVLGENTTPTSGYTITVHKDDDIVVPVPVFDDNGGPLDISGANFEFGVQNDAQSTVASVLPYTQSSDISGSASGIASITIPKDASFYGALAAGETEVELWWSLEVTLATKVRTRRWGKLIVRRKETTL